MPFNAQGLLNQLLGGGQSRSGTQSGHGRGASSGIGGLASRLGGGRGALAAGALGMLLGRKRGRGIGGGMGAAALGTLAFRAYTEWKSRQREGATGDVRTLDRVSGGEAETQSQAVLAAVIAAAKADGHIDERERQAIDAEFDQLGADPEARRWLSEQLSKPLDAAEVARAAGSEVVATQMYLASRLVVDTQNSQERAYLDELARCLRLDTELKQRLDREAEQQIGH